MLWQSSGREVVKPATNWLQDLSSGSLPANCDRVGPSVYDPRTESKGRLWALGTNTADNKFSRIMYSDDHGDSWTESHEIPDGITSGLLNSKLNMTSAGHFIWSNSVLIGRTSATGTSSDEGDFQPSEYLAANGGAGFAYEWQWGEFPDGTIITGAYANASNANIQTAGSDDLSGLDLFRSTDGAAANTWEHLNTVFDNIYPPVSGVIQHWHYVSVDPFTGDAWACIGDGVYNSVFHTTDKFDTIENQYSEDFVGLGFTERAVWAGTDIRDGSTHNIIKVLDKNNASAGFVTAYELPSDLFQQTIFYVKACGNELWILTFHHGETTNSTIFKFEINGTQLTLLKRFEPMTDNTDTDLRGFSDMNGEIPDWSPYIYIHVWGEGDVPEKTRTCFRIAR